MLLRDRTTVPADRLFPPPAFLPSLPTAFSRRAALFGAVTATGFLGAAAASGGASALSPNDARLVALADAYEAIERRCKEHEAANHHLTGAAYQASEEDFHVIVEGFGPIEHEVAETLADTLAGVLAKARMCQSPTARYCGNLDHALSLADDLHRLHLVGGL